MKSIFLGLSSLVWALLFALVVGAAVLVGFVHRHEEQEGEVSPRPLVRVGLTAWPGSLLVPLAKQLGYFEQEGISVDVTLVRDDERLERMFYVDGTYDIVGMTTADIVRNTKAHGPCGAAAFLTDLSSGGDALLGRPDSPPLSMPGPKRVSPIDSYPFFRSYLIDALRVAPEDIVSVDVGSDVAVEKLFSKDVDYIIAAEPYLSDAIRRGARVVYATRQSEDVVSDSLVASRKFLLRRPEAMEAFVRAYFRAYEYWKNNPDEVAGRVASFFDTGVPRFSASLRGISLLGPTDNCAAFTDSGSRSTVYGRLRYSEEAYNAEHASSAPYLLPLNSVVYPKAVRAYAGCEKN